MFAAKHSPVFFHDYSVSLATHAHTHVLVVSLVHSHAHSTHSSVLLHYHSFLFTAKHSPVLFHDDSVSLATHAHTHVLVVALVHSHAHTHVLVVSVVVTLVHHHALVAHAHVLVVSLVHHHILLSVTHILVHHHASIHKFRSEMESACWHSEVEDFDPLFTSPVTRKSLQWQFTRSDDRCAVSIQIVNIDPHHLLAVSYFDVHKLHVESWVLAAINSTLGPPVLHLANVNMHDWVH